MTPSPSDLPATTPPQGQLPALWAPKAFNNPDGDLLPMNILGQAMAVSDIPLAGRDAVEAGDLLLPTLRLLQGQSAEMTSYPETAKLGHFFHSTAKVVIKPPIRILVIAHTKSNALFPKDDNPDYRGLERCISRDAIKGDRYGFCQECAKCTEWRGPRKDLPPLGAQSHNFIALTDYGPASLRFSRTSFKAGREFLTTWTMSNKNTWAHPVVVTVRQNDKTLPGGKKSTYFSMDLAWQFGEVVPPEAQKVAYAMHQQIMAAVNAGRFRTDDEDQPETDA